MLGAEIVMLVSSNALFVVPEIAYPEISISSGGVNLGVVVGSSLAVG